MKEYEQFMPIFIRDEMKQINLEISDNQKIHIFVMYNESLFYTNDDHPIIWASSKELSLQKKG